MAHCKKLLMNMILLFVVLLSMNMATARVPFWNSDPHKPHGRFLGFGDPFGHNYPRRPPTP
ncbi:hypothetical protein PHAVU_005G026800 [Phaseolus vulgaris]|uniref:Transmembrane protein n=1 Tax=Phaseolus vulgaris TaxID=3885 RepID=V7BV51_PHAVU|nr:hypothetical protein PHAVU_005G026800g [Phaseolus vulgaris]ESW20930.1 hypothetical protein PHAVU_005G026800g [Phaseolus vulgaris]